MEMGFEMVLIRVRPLIFLGGANTDWSLAFPVCFARLHVMLDE